MARRSRSPVERYHDRVAGIYDAIYDGDAYWEAVFSITWRNILRYLPRDAAVRCLDAGCGAGRWGLRLARAGYRTDFLDISRKMLDQVAGKLTALGRAYVEFDAMCDGAAGRGGAAGFDPGMPEAALWHASIDDLAGVPSGSYGFLVGQGDPLNCAFRPARAFKELARLLRPGGVMVMSVDNRLQGIHHFLRNGDVSGLAEFLRTGRTHWITDDPGERYRLTMFTPGQVRAMCRERGLELLGLIGKTVLPLRQFRELLADADKRGELMRIEEALHAEEAMFANAAHLEFAARKPG